MATKIDYTKVDFDLLQQELVTYITSKSEFADVNRSGANFNLLVSLQAYIAELLSYNTNQVANEMNLSTVENRSNALRLIKELNYLPTQKQSSRIQLDVTPTKYSTGYISNYLMTYDAISSNGYSFYYLGDNMEITTNTISGVMFYEGKLVEIKNEFIGDGTNYQTFNVPNENIGEYINVFTFDSVNNVRTYWEKYDKAKFYATPKSQRLYFLEEVDGGYRFTWGNGELGIRPSIGERIDIEFIEPSGIIANGFVDFAWTGLGSLTTKNATLPANRIKEATVAVTVGASLESYEGAEKETIEDIKFNAPRFYRSQGRAVTEDDYFAMLSIKSEIGRISVLGGEKKIPKQLGKVFITLKPNLLIHPSITFSAGEMLDYKNYLLDRNVVSIEPILQNPKYIYLKITTNGRYSNSVYFPNKDNIKTTIYNFVNFANDQFGDYLEYSKLNAVIDNSDPYITSSITSIQKYVEVFLSDRVNQAEDGKYQVACTKKLSTVVGITKIIVIDGVNPDKTYVEDVSSTPAVNTYKVTYPNALIGTARIELNNGENLNLSDTITPKQAFFYFDTADNDIFLNQDQLFTISNSDITVTTEKV